MSDVAIPQTELEDLAARRLDSLIVSEKSISAHPEVYRQIKSLIRGIIHQPLDVADYYPTASRLGDLLDRMARPLSGTIFAYFAPQIDPCRSGDVRYLRVTCTDLAQQISALDRWRARRHGLHSVK